MRASDFLTRGVLFIRLRRIYFSPVVVGEQHILKYTVDWRGWPSLRIVAMTPTGISSRNCAMAWSISVQSDRGAVGFVDHRVLQHADAFDLDAHDVARFQ